MVYMIPHRSSFSEKRPRVAAWHPSDSDSTWYHDIKSIKSIVGPLRQGYLKRLPDYTPKSFSDGTLA